MPSRSKPRAPLTADALLGELTADPSKGPAILGAIAPALHGAMRTDARFLPVLRQMIGDPAILRVGPFIARYASSHHDVELLACLVAAWRNVESPANVREAVALTLLDIGDRDALEVLAAGPSREGDDPVFPIRAAMILDPRVAFERVALDPAGNPFRVSMALWEALRHPLVLEDGRWASLAVDSLAHSGRGVREAARDVLRRGVPQTVRAALAQKLLIEHGPAVTDFIETEEHRLARDRARTELSKIVPKLPSKARAAPAPVETLTSLRALLGRIPAWVEAFYAEQNGLNVEGIKPSDRLVIYPLETVLADARAWDGAHAPRETPGVLVPAFLFPVAPDGFTKAGLSGGPAFGFELPGNGDDDPILANTGGKPCFSTYVKRLLRAAARRA